MNFGKRKTLLLFCCTIFALAAIPTFVLGQGVDTTGKFELDGNATNSDASSPFGPANDWRYLAGLSPSPPAPAGFLVWTGVVHNSVGPNINVFTAGGSKDVYDVTKWKFVTGGSVPDKDQIEDAYAAAFTSGGHLIFVFGLDTFATNGARQVGFWFFKNSVAPSAATCSKASGCGFTGTHANGDVLVQVNFSTGGSVAGFQVNTWQNGALVPFTALTTGQCESAGTLGACAITNTSPTLLYWNYTPKTSAACGSTTTNCAPAESFFEGGIDITDVLGIGSECFTTFMAETRSSTSFSSELESFVFGNFNLCSIDIGKACPNKPSVVSLGTSDTFAYTFGGIVYNSGAGDLEVTVTDTFPVNTTVVSPAGSGIGNVRAYELGVVNSGNCQTWPTTSGSGGVACSSFFLNGTTKLSNTPSHSDLEAASLLLPSGDYGTFQSSLTSPTNLAKADGAVPGTTTSVTNAIDSAQCLPPPGGGISAVKGCKSSMSPANLSITVGYNGTIKNESLYSLTFPSGSVTDLPGESATNDTQPTLGSSTLKACPYAGGAGFPADANHPAYTPAQACDQCVQLDSNGDPILDQGGNPIPGNWCMTYGGSYTPLASITTTTGGTPTGACDMAFKDTVTVNATVPALNGTSGVAGCTYVGGQCTFKTNAPATPCPLCGCQ
jgi:hypothetical protein